MALSEVKEEPVLYIYINSEMCARGWVEEEDDDDVEGGCLYVWEGGRSAWPCVQGASPAAS